MLGSAALQRERSSAPGAVHWAGMLCCEHTVQLVSQPWLLLLLQEDEPCKTAEYLQQFLHRFRIGEPPMVIPKARPGVRPVLPVVGGPLHTGTAVGTGTAAGVPTAAAAAAVAGAGPGSSASGQEQQHPGTVDVDAMQH